MSVDHRLIDWIAECLEEDGAVTSRPMMGGATLYLDGTVFAILALDDLWFKADKASDAQGDSAGTDRFTYRRKDGRTATMNYRRAPSDVHDDPDAMRRWARLGLQAGVRAPKKAKRA